VESCLNTIIFGPYVLLLNFKRFPPGHFPRVTMCDFKVRVLGNLHNWSIQCVLQINMFNEKIYLFLWWWFLLVAIVNFINFFYWCSVTVVRKNRRDFVLSYLKVYDDIKRTEEDGEKRFQLEASRVNRFLDQYVRPDGVFVLRMIAANAGHIMTTNLTGNLWDLVYPVPKDSDV
uniref:Innexin n=1 Tax=Romanomermis culicivorax TaxID=13658 RepID=A0A915IHV3_ROMCU